jgi:hypothetical protein
VSNQSACDLAQIHLNLAAPNRHSRGILESAIFSFSVPSSTSKESPSRKAGLKLGPFFGGSRSLGLRRAPAVGGSIAPDLHFGIIMVPKFGPLIGAWPSLTSGSRASFWTAPGGQIIVDAEFKALWNDDNDLRLGDRHLPPSQIRFEIMPRYFFEIFASDNAKSDLHVDEGEELRDGKAAWEKATLVARDMFADESAQMEPGGSRRLEVLDEQKKPVLSFNVSGKR